MASALNTFWNRITAGLVAPTAEIHNKSARPIFLIPISCPDVCDPRSLGKVMDGLARRIPAGGSIQVDSRKYDLNERNPGSQIYILFRVGNSNTVEEFLKSLKKESLEGVKVKHGEQLFLHFHLLSNPRLYFNCDEAGHTIIDVNDVGQGVAAETQNESQLGNLIKEVPSNQQELAAEVKALWNEIAVLKNMLKRHDSLLANPNPSSSTDTPSPFK